MSGRPDLALRLPLRRALRSSIFPCAPGSAASDGARARRRCVRTTTATRKARPRCAQRSPVSRRAPAASLTTPSTSSIVTGSQQGLDLAARIFIEPGDVAVVEEPGYEGARRAFEAAGARLALAPVDAQGLDVRCAARAGQARASSPTSRLRTSIRSAGSCPIRGGAPCSTGRRAPAPTCSRTTTTASTASAAARSTR